MPTPPVSNRPSEPEIALHMQVEETDRGLIYDLSTLIGRRQVLKLAGFTTVSAGLMSIIACSPGASASPFASTTAGSSASAGSTASRGTAAADCAVIPEETAGPFPGDSSNGPNLLAQSGVVRQDIT